MAGVFSAPININAATSTAIDFIELLSGTTEGTFDLLCIELGQSSEVGDAQEEMLTLILKRVTGSPTSGSGGGTSTFRSTIPGGTAQTTIETGNTTKLTGGTSVELARFAWNIRSPFLYQPTPDEVIRFASSTRCVLELASAPSPDSIATFQGRVVIAELSG